MAVSFKRRLPMQQEELQSNLNRALQQALMAPTAANLPRLLHELDQLLLQLPPEAQLQLAGKLLAQFADLVAARSTHLLEAWEEKHSPVQGEPILTAEMLQDVLRHTMSLNLEALVAEPPSWQRQMPSDSVVGDVAKSNVLEFLERVDQEQAQQDALAVAHDEDVTAWIEAIVHWRQAHQSQAVSLVTLQRSLQMPLIQIWLALLLGGFALEQRGEFYQLDGIWLPEASKR